MRTLQHDAASRVATVPRRQLLDALPPRLRPEASLGILDVTKYFGTTSGGIKTYLLQKARYVAARPGLRHVLVVPGAEDEVVSGEGSRIYRLRGPRIPAHPPYRFLFATRSLRRIVEHERPDLIEVGSPFFVPWLTRMANRRLRAPTVWYYHSHLPRLAAPDPAAASPAQRLASRAMERYVRLLGGGFPVVLCGSRFAAESLRALGLRAVAQVPLGVDLAHFHPRRRLLSAATRRTHGLPDGPLALFAGRLATEKRIDVLLEAWPEIEQRTGVHLVLLGDGPDAERLRRHRHAPRVSWLPWQGDPDRLADLLAAASWCVAPGPAETFGLSVLEAMACGTPVLAVNAGAAAELVGDSGAGHRYTDGSTEDCVEAACRLAAEDLSAIGMRGRAFAEDSHAWDTVLETTFALYRRVARGDGLIAGEAP